MSSTGAVTLQPGSLLKDDNTYGGITDSVKALNLYTWTGSLLPTTQSTYCAHIGIESVKDSLKTMTDKLLQTYTTIKKNSDDFRFKTYPDIVAIANSVYDYASDAGGNQTTSLYASILQYLKDLNAAATRNPPAPQSELDGIKLNITELVNYQLQSIAEIQAKATASVTALQNYESLCGTDQHNLETSMQAFTSKLAGTQGDITTAEAQLASKRQELADDQEEYEKDVKIAATTVTYVWAWPIGPIIAAVIAGVYGDKAVRMKALIDSIKDLITSGDAQLRADKLVYSDLGFMKSDLKKVLDLIGPAITAIQKMIGDWQAIAGDLGAIKNQVGKANTVPPVILNKSAAQVIDKWNALKTAVDNYRRNAFVTAPTVKSVAEVSNDYAKVAKAA